MNILLVEDDLLVSESLHEFIEDNLGHSIKHCNDPKQAIDTFQKESFDIVMTDICMPGMDGITMIDKLNEIKTCDPDFIVFTAYADKSSIIRSLRAGVSDFLEKPINVQDLSQILNKISRKRERNKLITPKNVDIFSLNTPTVKKRPWTTNFQIKNIPGYDTVFLFSRQMIDLSKMLVKFHNDRTIPVMITGETGVGKEVVARLIHYDSADKSIPFISINCTAISPNLFESEMFGYEAGAFTGSSNKPVKGKFEMANGGTLFLDEIGDMPLEHQAKLLRVIQEREIYRVGGQKKIKLDVRIICSTNKDLSESMKNGNFRNDLFFRLNSGAIKIAPLREQKNSITFLAQAFLDNLSKQKGRVSPMLTKEAIKLLNEYSWPGNIREMKNAIEMVLLIYNVNYIEPHHFHFNKQFTSESNKSKETPLQLGSIVLPPNELPLETLEKEIIRKALEKFDNNKSQIARYLGLSRTALRTKLKKYE